MLKGLGCRRRRPDVEGDHGEGARLDSGRLGIRLDVTAWTGPLYQNANRLAHVYWLGAQGVRAWLVHLLLPAGARDELLS